MCMHVLCVQDIMFIELLLCFFGREQFLFQLLHLLAQRSFLLLFLQEAT